MITKPTVLVLGAGASIGFGYPSGPQLIRQIDRLLPKPRVRDLLSKAGFDVPQLQRLQTALVHCGRTSIDALLEHREDLLEVGKAAIAYIIMAKENGSKRKLFGDYENNWYMYLFDRLGPITRWTENRLKIVTYNYDRSLEYSLFTSAQNSFDAPDTVIANVISSLHIIHVHGRLDPLPHEDDNDAGRGYGKNAESGALIRRAAAGITIIHEKDDSASLLDDARGALSVAERICFLGFGYHEVNVTRLRFRDIPQNIPVSGTAFGLEEGERRFVATMLCRGRNALALGDPDVDCLRYLKQRGTLLP